MAKHNKPNYKRNTTYRKTFFSNNKASTYRCAYCGKRLKEEDVEVDHLIPAGAAQKKFLVRLILRLRGITDINAERNLVAACMRCNRKKSDNMGLWIYRGMIGRYKAFWFLMDIVRVCLFIGLCWFIWWNLKDAGAIENLL